jgi:peptidoglycan/LPS O-acetylase OafA/YrhL
MDRAAIQSETRPAAGEIGYRRWLDGLRGVAILAVLAYHFDMLQGGFLGVDVFFVLSGFLITTLLADEWRRFGSISLSRFYGRRALRLLPAFWVLLIVCAVWARFTPPAEAALRHKEIVLAGCYVINWPSLHQSPTPVLGHTWSLSVEEQFYLLWPLILLGLLWSGLRRRWVLAIVGFGVVASAVLRAYLYSLHRYGDPLWQGNVYRLYLGLDTRADALLVGCLVGLLTTWDLLPKSRQFVSRCGVAAVSSVVVLGVMMVRSRHAHHTLYCGGFTLVALLVAVILMRLIVAPSRIGRSILESWPLVAIGRISYALYLFQMPIIAWLVPGYRGWKNPLSSLVAFTVILAAAIASYFLIERPCLRLKGRLRRSARNGDETPTRVAA